MASPCNKDFQINDDGQHFAQETLVLVTLSLINVLVIQS